MAHFRKRWSSEYLVSLCKVHKWHQRSRNLSVGNVVLIREDGMVPAKWPLARVIQAKMISFGEDSYWNLYQTRFEGHLFMDPYSIVFF